MKKLKIFLTITLLSLITMAMKAQSNGSVEVKALTSTKEVTLKNRQESGKATYYGLRYKSGRKTASDKAYDKNKLTAAHKTLPFGTVVRVTNKKNGKTVDVEITDRGPFRPGRIIDLSVAAAKELDMMKAGVVPVIISILEVPLISNKKKLRMITNLRVN